MSVPKRLHDLLTFLQRFGDHLIYVIILVLAKSAAEKDILFLLRQRLVLFVQALVLFVVDRVVRLVTGRSIG